MISYRLPIDFSPIVNDYGFHIDFLSVAVDRCSVISSIDFSFISFRILIDLSIASDFLSIFSDFFLSSSCDPLSNYY